MNRFVAIVLVIALAQTAGAQQKLNTLTLTDTIIHSAVDRPGDFYVVTKAGQIQKFDKDGKLLVLYKATQPPTLFDPRDGARLFVYYRDYQHYEFFNPSFEITGSYKIDSSFAIQPWLMCPSGDHKLWLLDKADQSLKKINVRESEVELEVAVDPDFTGNSGSFKTMREYQGFVFLLNPARGIFIFNSLGKHIRTVEVQGIRNFNFLGEDLYYLNGDKLEFFNLFTTDKRQLPVNAGTTDVLLTDERMILITPLRIDIFAFRP